MRKLIPLTIYLSEEELQLLIEQTRRDNEINRRLAGDIAADLTVEPDAVAAVALVQWLRARAVREVEQ